MPGRFLDSRGCTNLIPIDSLEVQPVYLYTGITGSECFGICSDNKKPKPGRVGEITSSSCLEEDK